MIAYILRRVVYMIPTVFLISIASFVIISLPPGDYLTTLVTQMRAQGGEVDQARIASLQVRYGLDSPLWVQYLKWIGGVFTGDFGESFQLNRSVASVLEQRLPLTVTIAFVTLIFTWVIALPIGLYSAVRQYKLGDYIATTIGFLGLAIPNFLIALVLMYLGYRFFGQSVGGLYSPEYIDAGWNLGKLLDLLSHLWVPYRGARDCRDRRADPHPAGEPARRAPQAVRGRGSGARASRSAS